QGAGEVTLAPTSIPLDVGRLRAAYKSGAARPSEVIAGIYERIGSSPLEPVWTSVVPRRVALERARVLENDPLGTARPLYGVPFAVKDNIDVKGLPTTVGCPAYAYTPQRNATVVQALVDAGAIPIGKTSLDPFAAGLAATPSPDGDCANVFDARYLAGGSSAGSAVAVACGLVSFALGTDMAGAGWVPAACNNLVGLKPTHGLLSTDGVVPACRSLDCVSILAHTGFGAHLVWLAARGFDPGDPYSRTPRIGEGAAPWLGGPFRFGVPPADQLEFFGDEEAAGLYRQAIADMEGLGGRQAEIDFAGFRAAGEIVDSGPCAAERLAAIGRFVESHGYEIRPVVHELITGARRFSAVDAYRAEHKLRELCRAAEAEWSRMDILLLPTTGTVYTREALEADPISLNSNLGYYTNFANVLDLAAVAVPAGFRRNRVPFGVSLIGPAFTDEALLALADRFHRTQAAPPEPPIELAGCRPGCINLAVVGDHLTGQPLNHQLTERGARLVRACRTAPHYRLYKLDGAMPPKPGLVRDDSFHGPGIEVEVWAMPEDQLGGFVTGIPASLSIGTVALENGATVQCSIAEPYALRHATEITQHGGWRGYLAQHR
ncbi:MAG: allophanate hydrolase, partial [Bryobacteraceae bacterium]